MWKEGDIVIGSTVFHYWIKRYDTGSQWGIDGGRISKLMIKRGNEIVANYDRGWDVRPSDGDTEKAFEMIISAEN